MSDPTSNRKPILVLGVGNLLQTDDGVGVHVAERLAAGALPEAVEVLDGGTAGLDLLGAIEGRRRLIVIDAVHGDMLPGTVYRFTPGDVDSAGVRLDSLHQIGLLETLRMADLIGVQPKEVIIIGIEPAVVGWGMALTETVAAVVPDVLDLVRREMVAAVGSLQFKTDNSQNVG